MGLLVGFLVGLLSVNVVAYTVDRIECRLAATVIRSSEGHHIYGLLLHLADKWKE